jgi:hypothetical protein
MGKLANLNNVVGDGRSLESVKSRYQEQSFSLNMFGSLPHTNRFGRLPMFLRVLSAFLPMASATTKNGKNMQLSYANQATASVSFQRSIGNA